MSGLPLLPKENEAGRKAVSTSVERPGEGRSIGGIEGHSAAARGITTPLYRRSFPEAVPFDTVLKRVPMYDADSLPRKVP